MNAKTICESDNMYRLRAMELVYGLKRGTRGTLLRWEQQLGARNPKAAARVRELVAVGH